MSEKIHITAHNTLQKFAQRFLRVFQDKPKVLVASISTVITGINVSIIHHFGETMYQFFCNRYVAPNPQIYNVEAMKKMSNLLIGSVDVISAFVSFFVLRLLMISYQRHLQQQEMQNLQLSAELKLLRSQINPHFLFNSFHTLYSMVITKSDHAPEMVLMLAELMRYSYQTTENAMVPLTKELQHIETFLAVQKTRLGERADVQYIVQGDIHQWTIPPLLLLTFIENAFKHGLEEQTNGHLLIALQCDEKRLRFYASNTRPNTLTQSFAQSPVQKKGNSSSSGTGLENARRRLSLLYGNNYQMHIDDQPTSFTLHLEVLPQDRN